MKQEALFRVTFGALDTLRHVFRRRSFTAAAVALDVKQSSVSYTIAQLRTAFADPLFVRQGNVISPTERCIKIVAAVEEMLEAFEELAVPSDFDPGTTKASVTVSATYLSRLVLVPDLIRELRAEAPGITIELITGYDDAAAHLLSGRADLALSPIEVEASGVYGQRLFEDPYVCLMDCESPLAQGDMTLERYAAAPHLTINYGEKWQPPFNAALRDRGIVLQSAVSTPNPEDVRHIIPGTDLVVTMPSRIATQFSDGLARGECPIPAAAPLTLYWPARLQASPLHQWLRAKLIRLAKQSA